MSDQQGLTQRIARQVLAAHMERRRVAAIRARQEKAELERYERELEVICDDLCAEGFQRGSMLMWEAATKIMAARHLPQNGVDEYERMMRDTGF